MQGRLVCWIIEGGLFSPLLYDSGRIYFDLVHMLTSLLVLCTDINRNILALKSSQLVRKPWAQSSSLKADGMENVMLPSSQPPMRMGIAKQTAKPVKGRAWGGGSWDVIRMKSRSAFSRNQVGWFRGDYSSNTGPTPSDRATFLMINGRNHSPRPSAAGLTHYEGRGSCRVEKCDGGKGNHGVCELETASLEKREGSSK